MNTTKTTNSSTPATTRLSLGRLSALVASSGLGLMALMPTASHAFITTEYEMKTQVFEYHVPNDGGSRQDIREAVRLGVGLHGKRPTSQDLPQSGNLPEIPEKMTFKSLTPGMPLQVIMPSCPGAAFVVNAVDDGLARYERTTLYTACGFPSKQGWRVTFFASMRVPTGGIWSGAWVCPLIEKLGLSCDPLVFVRQSIDKLEGEWKNRGVAYSLFAMDPVLPERTLVADPFLAKATAITKAAAAPSLEARVKARRDLSSLGADPADRARMRQAVESGDEVLVELYVLAGAVDFREPDEQGKVMIDYARKDSIRALLKG